MREPTEEARTARTGAQAEMRANPGAKELRAAHRRRPCGKIMPRAALILALALVVALTLADGGQARALTQCAPSAACPDLVLSPKLVTAQLSADQRSVTVTAEVMNQGKADSQVSAGVEVSAPGWTTASNSVRPLKAGGDSQQVQMTLQVPDAARGHWVSLTVQVDPSDVVDESDEGNNKVSAPAILIPEGDLRVGLNNFDLENAGRTLVLHTTVRDVGKGTTAPTVLQVTSVTAGSSDWRGATDVPSLTRGASAAIDLRVSIPDSARGKTATLAVVVDPAQSIGETSYGDNVSNSLDVPIEVGDLTASILKAQPASDRKSLSITVQATNAGLAPTAATSVQVGLEGSNGRSIPVRSLDGRGSVTIPVKAALPADAAGTTVTVLATVDPSHDVAESSFDDNRATPLRVFVPKTPVTTTTSTTPTTTTSAPPDLVVGILTAAIRGDPELDVVLEVTNTGGEGSQPTEVTLSAPTLALVLARQVPALPAGHDLRLSITHTVPDTARGRHLSLRAVVDPRHDIRESSYVNNAATPFTWHPPVAGTGASWPIWLGAGAGALLVLVGLGYGARRHRLRLRIRWQGEAGDEEPPQRCQVPQTYVWRRKCTAKAALRSVEELTFLCNRDGELLKRKADKELIESLTQAVKAHRSLIRRRRLERLLNSIASDLCQEVEGWLAPDAREQVGVQAHLKGGKLECEFKRYKCAREGTACNWQERQKWSGEVEIESEEPVATLTMPLPVAEDDRARALRTLEGEVLAFIKRVDLPGSERPPETAPVAH